MLADEGPLLPVNTSFGTKQNPTSTTQQTVPFSSLNLDPMSFGNPAQMKPVSSSSQLPVPAAGQQITAQKPSKASRMLRGPIGRDQILEWQANLVSAHYCHNRLSHGRMPYDNSSCLVFYLPLA